MNTATKTDATQILKEWNEGDEDAPARLIPLVYEELRRLGAAEGTDSRQPEHLDIARLDGSVVTAEGLPYFVMGYVDGTSRDDCCEENRLSDS